MAEIILTGKNFDEEVYKSDIPVLVDFWAGWCGPCMMLAPIVKKLSEEKEGIVKVGKVNVDEEPALAAKFGIMSIPSLIVFKNGEIHKKSVGYMSEEEIEELFN